MRLIDADTICKDCIDECWIGDCEVCIIKEYKTKNPIDAVPVVRCGECKHWKRSGSEAGSCFEDMEPIGGCRWVNFCRKASDFCSYGERKDA